MATDGHILCGKCRQALYLGKHKDGRFWSGIEDESEFARGVLRFIAQHFHHGELFIMDDARYERFLEGCAENEWPSRVLVKPSSEQRLID